MCINNSSCRCHSNPCLNLGPYTAFNPQCETLQVRAGYMIPYASNTPFDLFNVANDPDNSPRQIAFGSFNDAPIAGDGTITLSGTLNEAFAVSQAGSIIAISAAFSNTAPITITPSGIVEVRAQIYKAPAGSNVFSPTNATIVIVSETTSVPNNTTKVNSSSVFPPVIIAVGERLLMVYSASTTGTVSPVTGSASASITIV